jgi:DNA-binding IclR family transcriptional regulator
MTKIEQIKKAIKNNRSKRGLTIHEVCNKSGVNYSTARRHVTRLLERGEVTYADYYKIDPTTKKLLTAYIPA